MNRTSLASNIVPYTAAMSGCGKAKYWQAAMALLEDMELKMFEAALDIYHQMDDQSVPASAVTFNSIMLACSNAREWQAGLMLLLNLKELRVLPDAVSYSTTICACGLGSAWQTALSLLRSLEHQRLYDLLCFSSAITACDSGGQWQRAFQIFWEARAQTKLDVMCHRVAARALDEIYECPQRWKLVQGLFVDLGDRALEADLAMHTTAAKCLGEETGDMDSAAKQGGYGP
ncbi:Pentatricopeptide repeat-containing protein At2g31400 [Durusdinium trenchii]|uniref:Chloroplastic n=2 Tax=Durusdinium trenchii TaxID=1381693 RepID=A0ABP0HLM7_9DINO